MLLLKQFLIGFSVIAVLFILGGLFWPALVGLLAVGSVAGLAYCLGSLIYPDPDDDYDNLF